MPSLHVKVGSSFADSLSAAHIVRLAAAIAVFYGALEALIVLFVTIFAELFDVTHAPKFLAESSFLNLYSNHLAVASLLVCAVLIWGATEMLCYRERGRVIVLSFLSTYFIWQLGASLYAFTSVSTSRLLLESSTGFIVLKCLSLLIELTLTFGTSAGLIWLLMLPKVRRLFVAS